MLPAAIFETALRETEELRRGLAAGTDTGEFIAAIRAECARRGWVQVDKSDSESWIFTDPEQHQTKAVR